MKLVSIKSIALLLAAAYFLLGVGHLAADACVEPAAGTAEQVLSAGCCSQNAEPVPANAHPCGACFDHCEPGSHSVHLGSSPFVKRLGKSLSAPLPATASLMLATVWNLSPPAGSQALLPNPTLASLRTVVLLN